MQNLYINTTKHHSMQAQQEYHDQQQLKHTKNKTPHALTHTGKTLMMKKRNKENPHTKTESNNMQSTVQNIEEED